MTTIAFDGSLLAADGRRLWGGEIVADNFEKIHRLESVIKGIPAVVGVAGSAAVRDALYKWLADGANPKEAIAKSESIDWDMILVDMARRAWFLHAACPYPVEIRPPLAIGAGGELATGAMLAGANAVGAVQLVGRRTNHSGGTVRAYDFETGTFFSRETHEQLLSNDALRISRAMLKAQALGDFKPIEDIEVIEVPMPQRPEATDAQQAAE